MRSTDELSLPEAGELYRRLSKEAASRRRRRRAGRAMGSVVSGMVVLAALVWAGIALSTVAPSRPGHGGTPAPDHSYRFSDVVLGAGRQPLPGRPDDLQTVVTISATVEWTGDTFPGWLQCAWSIIDPRSEHPDEGTTSFASPTPVAIHALVVSAGYPGPPAALLERMAGAEATISCSGPRLDDEARWDSWRTDPRPNYSVKIISVEEAATQPPEATVTYRTGWSTESFPGDHDCLISIHGKDGSLVGLSTFGFENQQPPGDVATMTVPTLLGNAASAELVCDPVRTDTPAAYVVSGVEILSPSGHAGGEGVAVRFLASWPPDVHLPEYPASNACTATVTDAQGQVLGTGRLGLSVGQAEPTSVDIGIAHLGAASLAEAEAPTGAVECHPVTAEDVYAADRAGSG